MKRKRQPWVASINPHRWTMAIGRKFSPTSPIVIYGDRALARKIVRLLNRSEK